MALLETGVQSGGGLGYRTEGDLLLAMRRMVHDEELRDELASRGFAKRIGPWSESEHVHRYMELISESRQARDARASHRLDPAETQIAAPRMRQPASKSHRQS